MPRPQWPDRSRPRRASQREHGNLGRMFAHWRDSALQGYGERSSGGHGSLPHSRFALNRRLADTGLARTQRNSRGVFHRACGLYRSPYRSASATRSPGGTSPRNSAAGCIGGRAEASVGSSQDTSRRLAAGVRSCRGCGFRCDRLGTSLACVRSRCDRRGGNLATGPGDLAGLAGRG